MCKTDDNVTFCFYWNFYPYIVLIYIKFVKVEKMREFGLLDWHINTRLVRRGKHEKTQWNLKEKISLLQSYHFCFFALLSKWAFHFVTIGSPINRAWISQNFSTNIPIYILHSQTLFNFKLFWTKICFLIFFIYL